MLRFDPGSIKVKLDYNFNSNIYCYKFIIQKENIIPIIFKCKKTHSIHSRIVKVTLSYIRIQT